MTQIRGGQRGQRIPSLASNLIAAIGSYDFRGRFPHPIGIAEAKLLGELLGRYMPDRTFTARDSRRESRVFLRTLSRGVRRSGTLVNPIGIAPTAVVGFAARTWHIPGLVATPSHNPLGFVGLKAFTCSGKLWSSEWTRVARDLACPLLAPTSSVRSDGPRRNYLQIRPADVRSAYFSHLSKLGRLRIRVVVDARGGSASKWASSAYRKLGAEVFPVNDVPSPTFCGCTPDPTPGSLSELSSRVVSHSADLGVTFDGDADRVLIVNHEGRYLWPEVVALGLLASNHRPRSPIVATADASPRLSQWASVTWSPRGARNVITGMRKVGARIGFETSDHYNLASEGYLSDGIFVSLIISKLLASKGAILQEASNFFSKMQRVHLVFDLGHQNCRERILRQLAIGLGGKWKLNCGGLESTNTHYGRLFLRVSQTEPLVRLTLESWGRSPIADRASQLKGHVLKIMSSFESTPEIPQIVTSTSKAAWSRRPVTIKGESQRHGQA